MQNLNIPPGSLGLRSRMMEGKDTGIIRCTVHVWNQYCMSSCPA